MIYDDMMIFDVDLRILGIYEPIYSQILKIRRRIVLARFQWLTFAAETLATLFMLKSFYKPAFGWFWMLNDSQEYPAKISAMLQAIAGAPSLEVEVMDVLMQVPWTKNWGRLEIGNVDIFACVIVVGFRMLDVLVLWWYWCMRMHTIDYMICCNTIHITIYILYKYTILMDVASLWCCFHVPVKVAQSLERGPKFRVSKILEGNNLPMIEAGLCAQLLETLEVAEISSLFVFVSSIPNHSKGSFSKSQIRVLEPIVLNP